MTNPLHTEPCGCTVAKDFSIHYCHEHDEVTKVIEENRQLRQDMDDLKAWVEAMSEAEIDAIYASLQEMVDIQVVPAVFDAAIETANEVLKKRPKHFNKD